VILKLEGVEVRYGRAPAVRGVDLELRKGEIVTLIGPNGAGKSSTLKAIFGLVRPTAGTIAYRDTPLVGRRPEAIARLGIALVPEGRHIFQTLTVAENLALGGAARGRVGDATLAGVLARFPVLERYYRKPAAGLSGGEQQQLAIARALLAEPELLILDEPSLGLAPLVTREVFAALASLRDDGLTVLLVEQNAKQALALADRAYVLRSGAVVASGAADRLARSPEIAAAYLGVGGRAA
jgi:branched-chain amino acid transport system ATP-binding protein